MSVRLDDTIGRTSRLEDKLDRLLDRLGSGHDPRLFASSEPGPHREQSSRPAIENSSLDISDEKAEQFLVFFKSYFLPWMPFIHLPDDLSARKLYLERPYVWLSIMVTCTPGTPDTRRLDGIFRKKIAEAMVVNNEKTMDLLLGALIFIAWYVNSVELRHR